MQCCEDEREKCVFQFALMRAKVSVVDVSRCNKFGVTKIWREKKFSRYNFYVPFFRKKNEEKLKVLRIKDLEYDIEKQRNFSKIMKKWFNLKQNLSSILKIHISTFSSVVFWPKAPFYHLFKTFNFSNFDNKDEFLPKTKKCILFLWHFSSICNFLSDEFSNFCCGFYSIMTLWHLTTTNAKPHR